MQVCLLPDPACHDLHCTKLDFLDHQYQDSTEADQAAALQQLMAQTQAEDISIEEAVETDEDEDDDNEGELDEEIREEVLEAIEEEEEEMEEDDDDDGDGSGRDMMDEGLESTRENADDISRAEKKLSAAAIDVREVREEAPVAQLIEESPKSGSSSSSPAVICPKPLAMPSGIIIEQAAANFTHDDAATYANPNQGSKTIGSPSHRERMQSPNQRGVGETPNQRELGPMNNQREAKSESPKNNNQRLGMETPNPNPSLANDQPPNKKKNEMAQKEKENLIPPNCNNNSDYNRIRKVAGHICLPNIPGSKGKIRKSLKQMNTIIKPINLDFGSAAARLKQQQQQQNVINNGDLQNKEEINAATTNGDHMNANSRRKISAVNGSSNQGQNPPSARINTNEDDQRPHSYTPSSHITINGGRASTESSPSYIRHRGSVSSDDLRKFSALHIRSRSSTRSERSSLRGGKIDRVARFAELQKIWRNDSFVRGIDGEKRPQILQHLFAPLRGNT